MLSNFHKNSLGTLSFDAKFPRMRKSQDFCVYPIDHRSAPNTIYIQSETRFGRLNAETGEVVMSKPQNYANNAALALNEARGQAQKFTLSETDLEELKKYVRLTAAKRAGSTVAGTDNSGASRIV